MAWLSLPKAIRPDPMNTVHLTPQLWAYNATDADVLPVEAQALEVAPTIFA